jgi:hypothetical protein
VCDRTTHLRSYANQHERLQWFAGDCTTNGPTFPQGSVSCSADNQSCQPPKALQGTALHHRLIFGQIRVTDVNDPQVRQHGHKAGLDHGNIRANFAEQFVAMQQRVQLVWVQINVHQRNRTKSTVLANGVRNFREVGGLLAVFINVALDEQVPKSRAAPKELTDGVHRSDQHA